jgi:hypothetical protein
MDRFTVHKKIIINIINKQRMLPFTSMGRTGAIEHNDRSNRDKNKNLNHLKGFLDIKRRRILRRFQKYQISIVA